MTNQSPHDQDGELSAQGAALPATVYVLSEDARASGEEVGLHEIWKIVVDGRNTVLLIVGLIVTTAIGYSMLATHWYRSEALLVPADKSGGQGLSGQLGNLAGIGGLASLTGLSVAESRNAEPIAVLRSRKFLGDFIVDQGIVADLLTAGEWSEPDSSGDAGDSEAYDLRDAVDVMRNTVLEVSEDKASGLVTLTVEWTDPEIAANWAGILIARLNERLRQQALADAERNVAYLRGELTSTSVATLQQSIGRLLETELQKLMLARGNDEFTYRVLDPAQPPRQRFSPKRTLTVLVAFIVGVFVAVLAVFVRHAWRQQSVGDGET